MIPRGLIWIFVLSAALACAGTSLLADDGGGSIVVNNPGDGGTPLQDPAPSDLIGLTLVQPSPGGISLPPIIVTVLPNSQMEFTLNISSIGSPAALHDFSFDFPSSELIDPVFTSALPAGWTFSMTDTSFSAENTSGSDLNFSEASTELGTLTFTLAPGAAAGTEFNLTSLSNISMEDTDGNAIHGQAPIMEQTQIEVVPEPSIVSLLAAAGFLGLVIRRFWLQTGTR